MLSRLRENLSYKVAAVFFAIGLHFYAIEQQAPHQPRTVNAVSVIAMHTPPGLLLDDKSPLTVSVILDGPPDEIAALPENGIVASVDLAHAHEGRNNALAVDLKLPPGTGSDLHAEAQPPSVPVILQSQQARSVRISVQETGTPPVGFAFGAPRVTPSRATVTGSREAVESVASLAVQPDADSAVDNEFHIVALDDRGGQVTDVTITPEQAHVRAALVKVPLKRALFINPVLVGSPPFPYKVADVQVSPQSVIVLGTSTHLAQVSTLDTLPIDVSGATADITRDVSFAALPEGVALAGTRGSVSVTVHIVTQQPTLAPAVPAGR